MADATKLDGNASAKQLVAHDAQLKTFDLAKWQQPADDATIAATKKKLEEKKMKVTVCDNKADALKVLEGLLPQGAAVAFGASVTLHELGFLDYVKTRADLVNYRAQALAAQAKNDWAAAGAARRAGMTAEHFFSSVSAVTANGEFITCDLTGTRSAPVVTAKNVVIVVGTNKIVRDMAAARDRVWHCQLPLESARCRIAYAAMGVTASHPNHVVEVTGTSDWTGTSYHVVLVKGAFGY